MADDDVVLLEVVHADAVLVEVLETLRPVREKTV